MQQDNMAAISTLIFCKSDNHVWSATLTYKCDQTKCDSF